MQQLVTTIDRVFARFELTQNDQALLDELQAAIGRQSVELPDPDSPQHTRTLDCSLRIDDFRKDWRRLQVLCNSLRAVKQATQEALAEGPGGLPVHNAELSALMRDSYDSASFGQLFRKAQTAGVFVERVDSDTGLVRTTEIDDTENREMVRHWVTDTVRCGDLQRDAHPETWPRAMVTLARFYAMPSEREAFDKCIKDPAIYRRQDDIKTGVAHIFDSGSLERDANWFNNKRLESHGLALEALCAALIAGANGAAFRFDASSESHDKDIGLVGEAIANLAAYGIAIGYHDAPSAGPWEEKPFSGGLTWDIEAYRAGLERFLELMHASRIAADPVVQKVRRLIQASEHAEVFADRIAIEASIEAGRRKIIERLVGESDPVENPRRPIDASLTFIAGSSVCLADDLREDVAAHYRVLDFVKAKLVRDHGMLRYAPFAVETADGQTHLCPDSYLSKNYWIAFDKDNRLNLRWRDALAEFGSKDASEPGVFLARARFATPNTEAEWFMVSDLAYGYGYQVKRLLERIDAEKRTPTEIERKLIERGMAGQTDAVNRAYARVTASGVDQAMCLKSNGQEGVPYAVPEAYEAVSTLDPDRPTGRLPGPHTPLAWARASLYRASKIMEETLRRVVK